MPLHRSSSEDTPRSEQHLRFRLPSIRKSLEGGTRKIKDSAVMIWHTLILRDHWQGEFAVAFFGALGWALIALLSPPDLLKVDRLTLLNNIMGEHAWAMFFAIFGITQLYGLKHSKAWGRLVGAFGLMVGFICVFMSEFIAEPWTLALAAYATCICIEVCSTIYQTAHIVRYQEYPAWLSAVFSKTY